MINLIRLLISTLCLLLVVSSSTLQAREFTIFFHNDVLGSPIIGTDEAGNVLGKENYSPFGERQIKDPAASGNTLWFAGKPQNESSGLSYFNARYYSPELGQFMSVDPVAPIEGNIYNFNRYAYANNNPYKYMDPDGRLAFLIPVGIFIAKEVAAEVASQYTYGLSDYLSVRRLGTKVLKYGAENFVENKLSSAVKQGLQDWSSSAIKKVDYSSIKNPVDVGPGKNFTLRQKQDALELNKAANGGVVRSDLSGIILTKPQKSQRGVTPDINEWQFDHITPKSCGGTNCSSNLQILSRQENRFKSDN